MFTYDVTSPILGSGQVSGAVRAANPMAPAAQARLHWQNLPPSNEVLNRVLKEKSLFQSISQQSRHADYSITAPKSEVLPCEGTLLSPPPSVEKRKADKISGSNINIIEQPRKRSIAPALKSSADIERQITTAQARIEIAKRQKEALQKSYEVVLLVQNERMRVNCTRDF